jgi:Tol biopolymer transport system component
VVVTATRLETAISDAPGGITVLSGTQMRDNGHRFLVDALRTTTTPTATNIPPTAEPPPMTPSPTPAGWLVTDWSNFLLREEGYRIYLLRPGQSSLLITPGKLVYSGQPWSPDGTKFIFDESSSFEANPPPELVMADLVTGQTSVINLLQRPDSIFWSPDGRYLLYYIIEEEPDYTIQMVFYDIETQENKVIAEAVRDRARLFYLVGWSPNSQKIAYVSEVNDQIDLFVLEVGTLAVRQLTNTPDIETIAIWSTTDDRLLFGTKADGEHALETWPYGAGTLYLVDDTGANLTMLFNSFYYSAAWSPNGEKIAYSNGGQICILDIETLSVVCPLEDTPPYDGYFAVSGDPPAWSADGNWLAFRATGHKEVLSFLAYVFELDTNMIMPVDLDLGNAGPLYWSRAVLNSTNNIFSWTKREP